VPRQLPKGVVEEEIINDAKLTTQGMTSIIIIQLILQLYMKGSLDEMMELYLTL
jgi:hypothetical protein